MFKLFIWSVQAELHTLYNSLGCTCAIIENEQAQTVIEYLHKSWEIAKERGYKYEETPTLLRFGETYISNSQYLTAIGYFDKALKIAKAQADRNMEAGSLLEEQEYKDHESTARNAIEELSLIIGKPIY